MDSVEPLRETGWRRPPVIVIGAHRSGTSATAQALGQLGLQLGQRLDSHFESKQLQTVHEKYLRKTGAAWYDPAPFFGWLSTDTGERDCLEYLRHHLRKNFAHTFAYRKNPRGLYLLARLKIGAQWGWKEPRTTLFAPLWLGIFPEARIVDVMRHPIAVALSIRRRELGFREAGDSPIPQLDDLGYCVRLALTYVEAGARAAGQARHYRRVRFEDLQANPSKILSELAEFCGLPSAPEKLARAANGIRTENSLAETEVSTNEARELFARFPALTKLGYSPP